MTSLAEPEPATPPGLSWRKAVALLAVSQVVGYGTIYYAYGIVAPRMAADFGVPPTWPFTVISVALLLAGLGGPWIGRLIDQRGAPRVMWMGSLAVATLYLGLAAAPGFSVAAVLVIALQVAAVTVLYSAAFPLLALYGRETGKQGIIWLGLIGGLASTIFWPLTGVLVTHLDWRLTFAVFALMHLGLALPAHRAIARRPLALLSAEAHPLTETVAAAPARPVARRLAFWLIALAFGLSGLVSTALLVHMVPLLELRGLGAQAYLAAALAGPAMVLARLSEILFWPRAHPIRSALISAVSFPLALLALASPLPELSAGMLFAVLYGVAHGLGVTSAGALPLAVFGPRGYAELLGRIGAVRVFLGAAAPALLATGLQSGGFGLSIGIGLVIASAGVVPLVILLVLLSRPTHRTGDAP